MPCRSGSPHGVGWGLAATGPAPAWAGGACPITARRSIASAPATAIAKDSHGVDILLERGFMLSLLEGKVARRIGAPGGSRTPGLQVRSLSLYPAELRARRCRV